MHQKFINNFSNYKFYKYHGLVVYHKYKKGFPFASLCTLMGGVALFLLTIVYLLTLLEFEKEHSLIFCLEEDSVFMFRMKNLDGATGTS